MSRGDPPDGGKLLLSEWYAQDEPGHCQEEAAKDGRQSVSGGLFGKFKQEHLVFIEQRQCVMH